MFISISYVPYVFLYNTINWPYQPKHSPSRALLCIAQCVDGDIVPGVLRFLLLL